MFLGRSIRRDSSQTTSDFNSAATVVSLESVSSYSLLTRSVRTWITGLSGSCKVENLVKINILNMHR